MTENGATVFDVMLRFVTRARHKAEACQSACWLNGQEYSGLNGAVLLSRSVAVLEAVASSVHPKNVDIICEAIQQRAAESSRPKDLGSFIEGKV